MIERWSCKLISSRKKSIYDFINLRFITCVFWKSELVTLFLIFRFSNARSTLADISTCNDSSRILIPLNSSLYVPGVIQQPDKVY